jgi:hypothetical protein
MSSPMELAVAGVLALVTPPLIAALRSTVENPAALFPAAPVPLLLPDPAVGVAEAAEELEAAAASAGAEAVLEQVLTDSNCQKKDLAPVADV